MRGGGGGGGRKEVEEVKEEEERNISWEATVFKKRKCHYLAKESCKVLMAQSAHFLLVNLMTQTLPFSPNASPLNCCYLHSLSPLGQV